MNTDALFIIIDDMDHSKFARPRFGFRKQTHDPDNAARPTVTFPRVWDLLAGGSDYFIEVLSKTLEFCLPADQQTSSPGSASWSAQRLENEAFKRLDEFKALKESLWFAGLVGGPYKRAKRAPGARLARAFPPCRGRRQHTVKSAKHQLVLRFLATHAGGLGNLQVHHPLSPHDVAHA